MFMAQESPICDCQGLDHFEMVQWFWSSNHCEHSHSHIYTLKSNMEPKQNGDLDDDVPFQLGDV